jgi:hypothetical protein
MDEFPAIDMTERFRNRDYAFEIPTDLFDEAKDFIQGLGNATFMLVTTEEKEQQ